MATFRILDDMFLDAEARGFQQGMVFRGVGA
jgi:hypothetical protein